MSVCLQELGLMTITKIKTDVKFIYNWFWFDEIFFYILYDWLIIMTEDIM